MLNDPTLRRIESDIKKIHDKERELADQIREAQNTHQQRVRELERQLQSELEHIDRERRSAANDLRFKEAELERHRDDLLKKAA
jgi:chromosome segregation ATPase